jgi:hypothetical protein
LEQSHPGIAPVQDEKGTAVRREATHHRQDERMLQDILAFADEAVGKTGESDGQYAALKDGSHEEGLNPPNGCLIQNQGDRACGLNS